MFEDPEDDLEDLEAPPSKTTSGFADRIAARLLWWRWLEGERAKYPELTTAQFDALTKDAREAKWQELNCGGGTKAKGEEPTEWSVSKRATKPKPKKRGRPPKEPKPPPTRICVTCERTLPLDAFPNGRKRRGRRCTACIADFRRRVVELRQTGLSFKKIGGIVKCSEATAHAVYHGLAA